MSDGMKLSILLAVSQTSRAGNKNGVKVFTGNLPCLFATHFVQKKAYGRMRRTSQNLRHQALACWEAKRLGLQQQDSLGCHDRLLGCGCITARRLELFLLGCGCITARRLELFLLGCGCITARRLELFHLTYSSVGAPE